MSMTMSERYRAAAEFSTKASVRLTDEARRQLEMIDYGSTEVAGALFGRISAPLFAEHRMSTTIITVETTLLATLPDTATSTHVEVDTARIEQFEAKLAGCGQVCVGSFHTHPVPRAGGALPSENDLAGWAGEASYRGHPHAGLIVSPSGVDEHGSLIWWPLRFDCWVGGLDRERILPRTRVAAERDESRDWLWEPQFLRS